MLCALPALACRAACKTKAAGKRTLSAGRDLVSDYAKGKLKTGTLKKQELPPELREMSSSELERLTQKKLARRKKVRAGIKEPAQKRDRFIIGKKKAAAGEQPGGFDRVVVPAVQKQAAEKGIQINFGG